MNSADPAITTEIESIIRRGKEEGAIFVIRTSNRLLPWQKLPYDVYENNGGYIGTVNERSGRRAVRQGETLQQTGRVLTEQGVQ